MNLFLLPFAGGAARSYSGLLDSMSDVCAPQAFDFPVTGRPYVDPPEVFTIQLLAKRLAKRWMYEDQPFAVFGHSMGALVAFEAARCLRSLGKRKPDFLILSSHRAPHLPLARPPLHLLSNKEFDDAIATYSGTPEEILKEQEMMDLIRPTLRRDFAACETYEFEHQEQLDIPVICMGGRGDKEVSEEDLDAWSIHTRTYLGSKLFPGGHFYFNDARNAAAREIEKMIEEACRFREIA
ncbi:thioesterase II family protein [Pannonibacter sp. SL95]|uniref:thioesterase II family protein n=1 Tax=Pannonibacter sp. SL95 TaxID=2995153 RepID=UPI00227497B2|nr:alpha/beta fold hydrolase [Pannonibacter sp. SL95]MCY1708685.1 alpha/beta fold hydrolase [Pannonibacter sp. SL95]